MRRVKKSRNGCGRCKSKRVKCDELQPECSRCKRLGVRCPGYLKSLRWITESPAASTSDAEVKSTAPDQPPALPQDESTIEPHDSALGGFDLEESNSLCDNLWDLPGGGLPELTDLSPMTATSPSFSQSRDFAQDFGQSGDVGADLSHFMSLIGPTPASEEHVETVWRDFSPSAIVRSYPPMSQRSAPRNLMTISRPLNNPSWTLIEYYFKEVAALFSSYDSQMNPFRTTVSRLWGSSLAMCRTMQSMAAATLVNDFPQFGPMGRKMRSEAVEIISREAVMDDKSLLALLMLGQTASWHDPTDLGISFFNMLRKQLNTISSSSHNQSFSFNKNDSNNYRFFEEALIYWEMLLSFVADNDTMVLPHNPDSTPSTGESLVLQRVPHPWTGIARETQFTVHEVGQLVRRERKRIRSRRYTSQDDITRAQLAIEKARELEERLLALAHPSEAEIVSPGDDDTPVWHLLTMAEVYRCTGLMQLYRVFPDLLYNRLPQASSSPTFHCPGSTASISRDPFFPIDLDSMNLSAFANQSPGTAAQGPNPPDTTPSPSSIPPHQPTPTPTPTHTTTTTNPNPNTEQPDRETLYNTWLTEFAITTLSRLKTIPLESRTRCLQPFLLVASCSELRLSRIPSQADDQVENDLPTDDGIHQPTISMEAIEVSRTRQFILGRLNNFMHLLPPKPIRVCLKLVTEVWRRMDAARDDVFWVDVMLDNHWETTMG
ncbi:hypothetical protein N7499_007273 [Penicillium canescens]|uniref:Zn(2)-C6 fungal-type domain-containing protein n=1 Tax=Penicillium canescens TaxID=5083 RepID=A0AAD6NB77_PENCN|nr:uncharacterized protein N7446_002964 [Penicillium canescens]KAJ6044770.1 hypothetical protein N7460_006125 [Penicillium canescens]KAJ6075187.1 hypothetical protein N7446_002964 [Penicillium canescens]KAJ6082399.1 hypothetical protein N7499_007273 [Penicillium canescens]KAJ6175804.1 hypothetical protein N7485_002718 [Penicillium canescens]